jgi:hypothetical protein
MKIHSYYETSPLYAAHDIKEGDLLAKSIGRKLRPAKPSDKKIVGIAMNNHRKGEEISDITTVAEFTLFTQ